MESYPNADFPQFSTISDFGPNAAKENIGCSDRFISDWDKIQEFNAPSLVGVVSTSKTPSIVYVKVGIIIVLFNFNKGVIIDEQNLFFSNLLVISDAKDLRSL